MVFCIIKKNIVWILCLTTVGISWEMGKFWSNMHFPMTSCYLKLDWVPPITLSINCFSKLVLNNSTEPCSLLCSWTRCPNNFFFQWKWHYFIHERWNLSWIMYQRIFYSISIATPQPCAHHHHNQLAGMTCSAST